MPELELFAYPWDIVDRGPAAFVDECAALGITRVHATTVYHSGKFLLPRNRTRRVFLPDSGQMMIPIPPGAFPGPIVPGESPLAQTGWLSDLSAACGRTGIRLAAWTVFHHGSALGARHPEFTVRNLFGDPYPFALCPSHEAVRDYSRALAAGVLSTGAFDTLDLETIGYLGYFHGHHHEVTAGPAGPLERFLLSLCFCDACTGAGARAGIDMGCLREQLREALEYNLRADHAGTHPADNAEQVASLLALTAGLREFIRLRLDTVAALVREIRGSAGAVRIALYTSSFVGSPSNIWMEGLSLPDLAGEADAIHLLAYTPDNDAVNGDLVFTLAQVRDPARLCLTLNLGLPVTPSLGHAMAKIEFAWSQGVRRFAFFNYGFLGEGRLGWIGEIAASLRSRERA